MLPYSICKCWLLFTLVKNPTKKILFKNNLTHSISKTVTFSVWTVFMYWSMLRILYSTLSVILSIKWFWILLRVVWKRFLTYFPQWFGHYWHIHKYILIMVLGFSLSFLGTASVGRLLKTSAFLSSIKKIWIEKTLERINTEIKKILYWTWLELMSFTNIFLIIFFILDFMDKKKNIMFSSWICWVHPSRTCLTSALDDSQLRRFSCWPIKWLAGSNMCTANLSFIVISSLITSLWALGGTATSCSL